MDREHLGIQWPIDEVKKPLVQSGKAKELSQAIPLHVKLWLHVEIALLSPNRLVSWLAVSWHLLIAGVLRFVHMQRSVILNSTRVGIIARASLGKSKRSGLRRPFKWSSPRFSLRGTDIADLLMKYLSEAFPDEDELPPFLLPEFMPLRVPLAECNAVAPKKMALDRFVRLSRQLFAGPPTVASTDEL